MILCAPLREDILDPSADDIRELLNQDDNFWDQGCGCASLSTCPIEDSEEVLIFYRNSGFGYVVLQYKDFKNYALYNEKKDKNTVIAHCISGEPFPVPHCFYVDYTQAESILLHYLRTSSILNYEQWRNISEIFNYKAYYNSDEYYNGIKVFNILGKFNNC